MTGEWTDHYHMNEPVAKEEFIGAEIRHWNQLARNFQLLVLLYGIRDLQNNEVIRTHFGLIYLN